MYITKHIKNVRIKHLAGGILMPYPHLNSIRFGINVVNEIKGQSVTQTPDKPASIFNIIGITDIISQLFADEIDQIKYQFNYELKDIPNKYSYSKLTMTFQEFKERVHSLIGININSAYFYA